MPLSPKGRAEELRRLREKADRTFMALKLEMADTDRAFEEQARRPTVPSFCVGDKRSHKKPLP
jgi:hypothetical protein